MESKPQPQDNEGDTYVKPIKIEKMNEKGLTHASKVSNFIKSTN